MAESHTKQPGASTREPVQDRFEVANALLVGIDLGTTVLKAAAFDARGGRALAAQAVRLGVRGAPDGTREQDLPDVESALRRATRGLARQLGRRWDRVAGVGLAAQGGSAIVARRQSGQALTPMQLWSDTRPLALLGQIAARKPASWWRGLTGLSRPGAGLARMLWLRQRRPDLLTDDNIYVGAGEYLYFRLTGQWRQDAGNALQVGCYDARRGRLDPRPLALVDVPASFVAPMRQGHQTHPLCPRGARLLGLPAGLPVAGPYMDHEAGYLSAAACGGRPLQVSLGTAWVGNFVLPAQVEPPPGFNLMLPSPTGQGRLVVRVMSAGNASWEWALRELCGSSKSRARAQARAQDVLGRRLLPPAGLVGLPWMTMPNMLGPRLVGSGGFWGVGVHTTREDLLRAVAAGMCFELARVFEPIRAAGLVDRVVLSGGASNGPHFRALLGALLSPLRVYRVTEQDLAGPRGATYAFSPAAARSRTAPLPRPDAATRRGAVEAYRGYLDVFGALVEGLRRAGASLPDDWKG